MYRLEELIEKAETGITTMTAEEPMTAVAIGTGKYVEFLSGTSGERIGGSQCSRGLYTGWTGMVNEQKRLDVISNNLANAEHSRL